MPMTAERFKECLAVVDWTIRGIADRINVSERQVRRWANGHYPVPEPIGDWLEMIAQFHEQNPLPPPPPERHWVNRARVVVDA